MDESEARDARSAAEREGIVDQQDAALAAMEASGDDAGGSGPAGGSAEGDAEADADADADESNEGVNPSRPPAEGGREEVDEP